MTFETSTEKMAAALEATGLEPEMAEMLAANQSACIVCGHGTRPSGAGSRVARESRASTRPSCQSPGRGDPLIAALDRKPVGC